MKSTLFIFIFSITFLAFASSQPSRANSKTSSKKRLTQAEWYRQKAKEDADRRAAIHDARMREKSTGMSLNPSSYSSSERSTVDNYVSASANFYEIPAVKKLGIKPPPRNRLKQDPYVPAQEQQRAKFLDKQALRHRELTSRLVNFSKSFSCASISSLVSDLNRVASSHAWKRMANSNTNPLLAGEENRFRDEISGGLSSVDSSLDDLEYRATHNGEPNSIVHVFSGDATLPEGWHLAPADRRQRKFNILIMRAENDSARDEYIQNHPEDPHAYNFIPPKAIGAGGHVITNPRLLEYNPDLQSSPLAPYSLQP